MRCVLLAAVCAQALAWVLPGTAPTQFADGEKVELKVGVLGSSRVSFLAAAVVLLCHPPVNLPQGNRSKTALC
jgi:hypothetical protein